MEPTTVRGDSSSGSGRESRAWRGILNFFLKGVPTPVMRVVRNRVKAAPIEEFVITGRRTGRERRMLLGLFEVDGAWYVGHPNGSAQWVRNLEAAGRCTVIRRDGVPVHVLARELPDGEERDAVIRKAGTQPAPAGGIYRGAAGHIQAVGRYFRLSPVPVGGNTGEAREQP
jgi:deazaflavin-dependent oxidoreductase (nitroreductase family)